MEGDAILWPVALRLLLKMRQALVIVHKWLSNLPYAEQIFGQYCAWLAFVEEKDKKALKLAIQAPGDRID